MRYRWQGYLLAACLLGAQPVLASEVVFIPKGASHVFWKEMARGAGNAALGQDMQLLWRGPALESAAVAQGRLIDHYRSKGVAAMIVAPNAAGPLLQPLKAARQAGCKLVIVDSPLQPTLGLPYVGTHNQAAGESAGEYAANLKPPPRKVLLLRFSADHDSTRQREDGFGSRLRQLLPNVQIIDVADNGITMAETRDKAQRVLAQYGDADLVFTPNESTTEGAIYALQAAGLAGKVRHVGFDYSPLIDKALRAGSLQAVVTQDPYQIGVRAMEVVGLLLQGKPVAASHFIPASLVTASSLAQPAVDARLRPFLGYLPR